MADDAVIRVEGLGKRYVIRHKAGRAGYGSLRDTIADGVRSATRRLLGRPTPEDATETEEFWALRDVSFTVKRGEVVGIIGRNGAGKSTLLKVLSRITEPTTGRIDLDGRVASLLEVGTGFHPELTGRENVYLNGAILGMSRAEIRRKFDEIVAFAEVEKFLDTPVKRYSSGMYTRLAFAVAAHLEPEILIVDEVLAVGDAAFQKKCLGKMGEVAKGGRTVLFVSHNMTVITQLCERAVLLRGGALGADGRAWDIAQIYMGDALVSACGQFDLRQHPARSPSCIPLIHGISLSRASAGSNADIRSLDRLDVVLDIVPNRPLREPRVAVAIEDAVGRRITTVASYFGPSQLAPIEEPVQVRCSIPALPLGPGRYLVSVSLAQKHEGLLDSIDGAAWFDVRWDNRFGNGEDHSPVYGPVLCPSEWAVNPR